MVETRYELLEKYVLQRHEDLYQAVNIIDPDESGDESVDENYDLENIMLTTF